MNPAYSVIFFTVSSGAGYGLLILLMLLERTGTLDSATVMAGTVIGLVLVSAGLLSSTFHLGHPERAWRALSQWRTSWLSREGVLALIFFVPALTYAAALWFELGSNWLWSGAAATWVLGIMTVIATAMIYASLATVPRWHTRRVVVVYLTLALASGSLLTNLLAHLMSDASRYTAPLAAVLVSFSWLIKWTYWRFIDTAPATASAETATGLGDFGRVSQFEGPHTSRNFVMREMGYVIARKHALKLRQVALLLGAPGPVIALAAGANSGSYALQSIAYSAAAIAGMAGILLERWLFFAEAEHVATLYYGTRQV